MLRVGAGRMKLARDEETKSVYMEGLMKPAREKDEGGVLKGDDCRKGSSTCGLGRGLTSGARVLER